MRQLTVKLLDGKEMYRADLTDDPEMVSTLKIYSDGLLSLTGPAGLLLKPPYTVEVTEDTEAATGGGSSGG